MIFIFPTQEEAQLFVEKAPTAHIEISGVAMAACGSTVARCAVEYPGEMLILAGIAGGYDVAVGEVVEVVEERIEELPSKYAKRYQNRPHFADLKSVTSNTVSSSGHKSSTANIENMEGAALFAICAALGVKCAEVRAISNSVGAPFDEWKIEEALEALTAKLIEIWQCK
ncbi:MAG: hypothetical protein SNH35_02510 [Rikenellaceae bacterium]